MGVADALSMGSLALGVTGALGQSSAQSAGSEIQQQNAINAATAAKTNALQTDAYYQDNLTKTLSNIEATRASSGVTPDSPTGQAIDAEQTRLSDLTRTAKVTSLQAQSNQDMSDANYYGQAASMYSGLGILKAGSMAAGAFGGSPAGQSLFNFGGGGSF